MTAIDLSQDPVITAWYQATIDWETQIAALTEKRKHAIELIKERMGDAEQATLHGQPVITWAWSRPGRHLDAKALAQDLPQIAERYTVEKAAARPFKILDVT